MNKNLDNFSNEKIEEIIERYYSGESVNKLIEEFNLSVRSSMFYKLFPPEEHTNYVCEFCGNVLVTDRKSKSMYNQPKKESELYCLHCGHKPYKKCNCDGCKALEYRRKQNKLDNIQEAYGSSKSQKQFDDLTFTDKVYLGALCRAYLRENLYEIAPMSEMPNVNLAPTTKLSRTIYDDLVKVGVISVSPLSNINAFEFDSDDYPEAYYVFDVVYNMNLVLLSNKQDLCMKILNPTYYNEHTQEEAFLLWKAIALEECIEYLVYSIKEVGFEFSPGDKTYTTFDILLKDFSVSQIYGIIWKSVANASKLYLQKKMPKKQAANSVIGGCERYAEQAKINEWELPSYNRIKDLPQTAISEFFFNKVLKIGVKGFDMPPCIIEKVLETE